MDLSILLPTFNRTEEVKANLVWLSTWCNQATRKIEMEIVLSQNCPQEKDFITNDQISSLINAKSPKLSLKNLLQPQRLSPGRHFKKMFENSKGKWVMWIGDDDILAFDYLNCIEAIIIANQNISAIEARYTDITRDFFFNILQTVKIVETGISKWAPRKVSSFLEGFNAALRGQQLSGLVFRRKVISDCYEKLSDDNMYPWICFLKYSQDIGVIARVSEKRIFVTGDTPKTFTFGSTALIPEISDALVSVPNQKKLTSFKLSIIIFYWPFIMNMLDYSCRNIFDLPQFISALHKDKRISRLQIVLGLPGIIFFGLKLGFKKRQLPKRYF